MNKDRIKTGTGIILIAFTVMYIVFCVMANIYAFSLKEPTDPSGLATDTLRLAVVIMDIAVASFTAFSVCWNIRAHKGWRDTTSLKMFRWLCINAVVAFFLPPSVAWNAADMFPPSFAFMAFTPVLLPVVMMLAAAVAMLDIIKQKNGGTLRKRR